MSDPNHTFRSLAFFKSDDSGKRLVALESAIELIKTRVGVSGADLTSEMNSLSTYVDQILDAAEPK
ncbi:hypothetical protein [Pseudomonas sp.]|uniref:hypothetical protein n=1 Tax=Pseudomonas sp. TaxID=306 RepID=UPI0028AF8EFF|nr:hypothetical protein [Pseudomonas sp.]